MRPSRLRLCVGVACLLWLPVLSAASFVLQTPTYKRAVELSINNGRTAVAVEMLELELSGRPRTWQDILNRPNGIIINVMKEVAHYSALLASYYVKLGEYNKALREYTVACTQLEELYPIQQSFVSTCYQEQTEVLERLGRQEEAQDLRERVQMRILVLKPEPKDVYMQLLVNLAKEYALASTSGRKQVFSMAKRFLESLKLEYDDHQWTAKYAIDCMRKLRVAQESGDFDALETERETVRNTLRTSNPGPHRERRLQSRLKIIDALLSHTHLTPADSASQPMSFALGTPTPRPHDALFLRSREVAFTGMDAVGTAAASALPNHLHPPVVPPKDRVAAGAGWASSLMWTLVAAGAGYMAFMKWGRQVVGRRGREASTPAAAAKTGGKRRGKNRGGSDAKPTATTPKRSPVAAPKPAAAKPAKAAAVEMATPTRRGSKPKDSKSPAGRSPTAASPPTPAPPSPAPPSPAPPSPAPPSPAPAQSPSPQQGRKRGKAARKNAGTGAAKQLQLPQITSPSKMTSPGKPPLPASASRRAADKALASPPPRSPAGNRSRTSSLSSSPSKPAAKAKAPPRVQRKQLPAALKVPSPNIGKPVPNAWNKPLPAALASPAAPPTLPPSPPASPMSTVSTGSSAPVPPLPPSASPAVPTVAPPLPPPLPPGGHGMPVMSYGSHGLPLTPHQQPMYSPHGGPMWMGHGYHHGPPSPYPPLPHRPLPRSARAMDTGVSRSLPSSPKEASRSVARGGSGGGGGRPRQPASAPPSPRGGVRRSASTGSLHGGEVGDGATRGGDTVSALYSEYALGYGPYGYGYYLVNSAPMPPEDRASTPSPTGASSSASTAVSCGSGVDSNPTETTSPPVCVGSSDLDAKDGDVDTTPPQKPRSTGKKVHRMQAAIAEQLKVSRGETSPPSLSWLGAPGAGIPIPLPGHVDLHVPVSEAALHAAMLQQQLASQPPPQQRPPDGRRLTKSKSKPQTPRKRANRRWVR